MIKKATPADHIRGFSMKWIWVIAFFVVVVVGGIMTPWQAIYSLLANKGVGDQGAVILSFVAGYTLPLTAAFGIIAYLFLTGANRGVGLTTQIALATIILAACGWVASDLGLGLLPDYQGWDSISAPGFIKFVIVVFSAYFNSYGLSLMLCALAIGTAVAIQIERFFHGGT
jgi:hypothetical protein